MGRYKKETTRLFVKFVRESDNHIILQIPITAMEVHDYFKSDYIHSILRNTFGDDKLEEIGDVLVVIDQKYVFS